MITQEMIEVAVKAMMPATNGWDCFTQDALRKIIPEQAEAALKAVYPLILEQAAGMCDSFSVQPALADKIRNLKDKTDEAHNG